jgi:hypothetical protein
MHDYPTFIHGRGLRRGRILRVEKKHRWRAWLPGTGPNTMRILGARRHDDTGVGCAVVRALVALIRRHRGKLCIPATKIAGHKIHG